jgi:hypothetical protein
MAGGRRPGHAPARRRVITAGRVGRAGLGTLSDSPARGTAPEVTAAVLLLEPSVASPGRQLTATSAPNTPGDR